MALAFAVCRNRSRSARSMMGSMLHAEGLGLDMLQHTLEAQPVRWRSGVGQSRSPDRWHVRRAKWHGPKPKWAGNMQVCMGRMPPGAVRPQVAHARERRSTCDAPIPTPLRSGDERWRYGAEVEANALAQRMYHPAPALWRRLSFASHICLLLSLLANTISPNVDCCLQKNSWFRARQSVK